MSKVLVKLTGDRDGTVLDVDTVERFIETARNADDGQWAAIEMLPASALYVANRLAELLRYDDGGTR